jgi:oligosaccharide repeat unit polymerase
MLKLLKINTTTLALLGAMLLYVTSIAIGAEIYLPYQTYAPGIFREYSLGWVEYILLIPVTILCASLLPKRIDFPSDWFLIIFVVFLLAPGLTLGISSDDLIFSKKIIVLPAFIASIFIIAVAKNVKIKQYHNKSEKIGKVIPYASFFIWVLLLLLLIVNYHGVMQFSSADSIYAQRELTSDVGGVWGYIQLFFTYVCSTLLVAYGLSSGKWRYFIFGSAGYFVMYLITAEKSQLMFPIFFLAVNYILRNNINPAKAVTLALVTFSCIIFGAIYLGQDVEFFNLAGFYLFSRLIAAPSQFVLDYYDYFSSNGYTFFSQVRGFDFFIDAPLIYSSNPKWPQLGWIVGSGMHGIESNSNATFIASDGAASLGVFGMIFMACVLCCYLIFVNHFSQKFERRFWSAIFSQQAFILMSGSFFSLILSFGGLFYLLLFALYKSKLMTNKAIK